ncbi:hypothetical protein BAE44_0019832 [Dichanthelium oligosanthes]|uniref:Uncharacterized protein n=1 Tax=Dichanthelium oligosanthes TaxID=888268 RepID=A0A1E5V1V8_9POAL|nr:hypothetical protein BAE44_0019832 [Dichanthelium oligosanthes]
MTRMYKLSQLQKMDFGRVEVSYSTLAMVSMSTYIATRRWTPLSTLQNKEAAVTMGSWMKGQQGLHCPMVKKTQAVIRIFAETIKELKRMDNI